MKVPKAIDNSPRMWPVAVALLAAVGFGVWVLRARSGADLDADQLWKQAHFDFEERRYESAAKAVSTLAKLRKPTSLDLMLRAQLALVEKRADDAVAELAKIPDHDPMTAQARLLTGQVELRRNRMRFAEKSLLAAAEADPKLVMPHRELIYIYGMQVRRPELSAQFLALSKLAPLTYDNAFHWSLTRNSDWERLEHNRLLNSYLEADSDDRFSRIALAENLRQLGRRDEADRVLAPLPDSDPEARVVRVWIALDRNDEELAEKLLAEAPENVPELDRLIGRLALARGDGKIALKHFQAAHKAQPDNRDGIFGLGQALVLTGDPATAAPYLQLAKDHDALGTLVQKAATPEGRHDPSLFKALGAACEKVKRIHEALAWYNLAIQADVLDNDAQKAIFRLKTRIEKG